MFEKDLTFFGAQSGGQDNSEAFREALNAVREAGGGCLRIGCGIWRTGPIELFSGTTLLLDEGCTISFIPEPERYGPVETRWEGIECYAMKPLVFADNQNDITVKGRGVFDGSGEFWWNLLKEKRLRGQNGPETALERKFAALNPGYKNQPGGGGAREIQFLRPPLFQLRQCRAIHLEGFTLQNSPFWTLHPLYCAGVTIKSLTVKNPADAPNTDGIDIDSCENVIIEDCAVTVGDDGIAIKSGSGEDGIRVNRPSRNITVKGCLVKDGHGGIVIGSETAAGIFNVNAENCVFQGTDRGIRIKTRRGRGGEINGLSFSNITMENNLCPLTINMFYRCGAKPEDSFFCAQPRPVTATTPVIKNVSVKNIKAAGCRASAGFIAGLPEAPIENFSLDNCEFSTDENDPAKPDQSDMFLGLPEVNSKSFRILNTNNPTLTNVRVTGPKDAFIYT